MTIEDKKRELCRYRLLVQRIERKKQERQRWLDIGTKITPIYSDMPKSAVESNKVEQAGMERAQIAGELAQDICGLAKEKRRIEEAISGVEDERLRLILEKHYIDGLTFEQIAENMGYSWRYIMILKKEALDCISFHGISY